VYIEAAKSFVRLKMVPQALRVLSQVNALALGSDHKAQKEALERAVVDYIPRVDALAAMPPGPQRSPGAEIIVVRGAVDALIAPVVKHYRAAHPGVFLILSTWANTETAVLADVAPYFDDVVLNQRPKSAGVNNINFQLACAVNGVNRARDLGAQRIMVTRTDIALLRPNLLDELRRRLFAHPSDPAKAPHLKQRLVVSDLFTQLVPFYHPSDLFCYGAAEDVAKFWADASEVNTCTGPEPFLCRKFAARAGRPLANHYHDSLWAIRDLFVVCDASALQLYWQKNPFWPNAYTLIERGLITEKVWEGTEKPYLKISADVLPRWAAHQV
ncbi:MAG: hypothetical protein JNM81_08260, partial [Rhodospirillaceae bacterium]|nr:hypothetical protein [Rhodospirillaceae bacterium]